MKEKKQMQVEENVRIFDKPEIVAMTGDDGSIENFAVIAVVDREDGIYVLMQPDSVDQDEALIFKMRQEDDLTDLYLPVLDNSIASDVFNEYLKAMRN
ncbi:MAG: DUF1292 domain-containing protein [Clostridiales bacterium]|jgi:uncharacterized protein YrzB (UPF0473 family)|nr:DUF1292 domain-containing protein [Clostridiales bacterium]